MDAKVSIGQRVAMQSGKEWVPGNIIIEAGTKSYVYS